MVVELSVYSESIPVWQEKSKIHCALQGNLINTGESVHELLVKQIILGPQPQA